MKISDDPPWFVSFPFLTRHRGRAIVVLSRLLRLSPLAELWSPSQGIQFVLDVESARMLKRLLESIDPESRDIEFRGSLVEELEEFIDLADDAERRSNERDSRRTGRA